MVDIGSRLQSSMRTHFVENIHHGNKINKIELGRISKVNYQTNSVGFFLLTTGVNGERASADKSYSAMLPMSIAGRNSYGKAYGDLTPVRVGDIVLVGFVDDKVYRPIVLGVYPDEAIAKELSRSVSNDIDPSSVYDYAIANSSFKVYPDQTYDYHDGLGTRILTFSGHSFFIANADSATSGNLEHKTDDSGAALDYADLSSSYFSNKELIEPVSDKAPEIIFKHQGIVDSEHNPDTHALYLYIGQDGTYRVSQMKTDEDWRTYFEIKNSKIHLVRQKNSKVFGGIDTDSLESSELSIDEDGSIVLRNHNVGLIIKNDGIYSLAGEKLLATQNAISDLILDKLGGLGFGGANLFSKSTATLNTFLDEENVSHSMQGALVSDYITCIGNNAYYAYAYAEKDVFDKDVTLSLTVYDSNKKFIEGKEAKGNTNVQIATRALPIDASYIRVSIDDGSIPIMVAYGSDYSAYQPSYTDIKASKNTVADVSDSLKQDYLTCKQISIDALNDKVLAMQNITDALQDSILSTADKQLLKSYMDYAHSKYDSDIAWAYKYEANFDDYKRAYNQLLGKINPLLDNMSTSVPVSSAQIKDVWDVYFSSRCNLTGRVENSSQSKYEASVASVNTAQVRQGNSMLKQFTEVTNTLQSIMQTTKWIVWTDDLDLNNEKVTENILFKGRTILHSPVDGSQYIQVFSAIAGRSSNSPVGVTQRVWSTESVVSYSRVLAGNEWSKWTLDSSNSNYDEELNNIVNSVANIGDKLNHTSNDLSATKESITQQINDSSVTLAQYKHSNDARVSKLETDSGNHDASIKSLLSSYTAMNSTLKSANDKIESLTATVGSISNDIADIHNDIKGLNNTISQLSSRISALEGKK